MSRVDTTPQTGTPSKGKKKKILIAVIGFLVFLIILGLAVAPPVEKEPEKIGLFRITGTPETDTHYGVFVGLQDEKNEWVVSSGKLTLTIYDNNGEKLYEETRTVTTGDYSECTYSGLGQYIEFTCTTWNIPISNVKPGVPDILGLGKAEIKFETKSGKILNASTILVIPKLPPIEITGVDVNIIGDSNIAKQIYILTWPPIGENYRNATIDIYLSYVAFGYTYPEKIRIDRVEIVEPNVKLVEVKPSLPQVIYDGDHLELKLTITAPNGFKGRLTVNIYISS